MKGPRQLRSNGRGSGVAWAWQDKKALRAIREQFDGSSLASIALAVYLALTEIASDQQSETFETTLSWVALMAGASVSSVKRVIPDLEAISLVNVRRTLQGGKGPSTYSLLSIAQSEPSKVPVEPSNSPHVVNLKDTRFARMRNPQHIADSAEPSKVPVEPSIALTRNTPSRATLEESKNKREELKEAFGDAVASLPPSLDLAGSEEEPEVFSALRRILQANLRTPGTSRRWMAVVRLDCEIFNEAFDEYERTLLGGNKVTSPLDWIESTCKAKCGQG